MKLEQGTHTQTKKKIYYIKSPETLAIKDKLGRRGAGLSYWRGMWWTYKPTPRMLDALDQLGIDTSEVRQTLGMPVQEENSYRNETGDLGQSNIQHDEIPANTSNAGEITVVDREWGGPPDQYNSNASEKAKFPVKQNIYETDISVPTNEGEQIVHVSLARNFMPGRTSDKYRPTLARGYKGFPIYLVSVTYGDKFISRLKLPINRKSPEKRWDQIDEAREIVPLINEVAQTIFNNPQSKSRQILEAYLTLGKRDAEFQRFIKEHTENEETFDIRDVPVPYKGKEISLPVKFVFYKFSEDLTLRIESFPALDPDKYPQAPKPSILGFTHHWDVPYEIKNMQEFSSWFEKTLEEHLPEIQEKYSKYLDSFPFGEEEMENAQADMSVILGYLANGSVDTLAFKQKLMEMGYLRPSKRQRTFPGGGMVPEEKTVYVLDHKKIVDDAYRSRRRHDPNSFYTVMAYYLHRLKKNITSWTDMMLTTFINQWQETANRFGLDMGWREVQSFFDNAARSLYEEIFKDNAPRSRVDQYTDFYSGFHSNFREKPRETQQTSRSLDAFANFVSSIGGDGQLARTDPKKAYRQMALKYHPDQNPDPKAASIFSELSQLWEKIRSTVASSMNWLQKIAYKKEGLYEVFS